ncbi:hypothetical protein ACLB2K_032724 [Fragaria x ananassa]
MKRQMVVLLAMVMMMVISTPIGSEARELRPSDHGLGYTPSAGNASAAPAEAKSFFTGGGGGGEAGGVALPKAMNSNDTSWWEGENKARDGGRRGHVRDVLVVVSLVCGITGVLLFVASSFVYLSRRRKRKAEASSS